MNVIHMVKNLDYGQDYDILYKLHITKECFYTFYALECIE